MPSIRREACPRVDAHWHSLEDSRRDSVVGRPQNSRLPEGMASSGFPEQSATLAVRFVIYLPLEPCDPLVDAVVLEQALVRLLCEKFGGVTAYPARGTFALSSGQPTTEPVMVLETYCERQAWGESEEGVGRLVRVIGGLLRQESIGCSIDGRMIVVSSSSTGQAEVPSSGDPYSYLRRVLENGGVSD